MRPDAAAELMRWGAAAPEPRGIMGVTVPRTLQPEAVKGGPWEDEGAGGRLKQAGVGGHGP